MAGLAAGPDPSLVRVRAEEVIRRRFTVTGIVQGVGFRPFVHGLAAAHGLVGRVENTGAGVRIEVQGPAPAVGGFAQALAAHPPPLAVIDAIAAEDRPVEEDGEFRILTSSSGELATALVSPDVGTCADCRREIADPSQRRYGYPFTNCTNCGHRYTIVTGIPYDRPNTTMAPFPMCDACAVEYHDPTDRRFHAQPVCCPDCGPQLSASLDDVVAAWGRGEIVAVKGLGGYHLTALAGDDGAVGRLRARKHREDKPFALMEPDLAWARALCEVSEAEAELLESTRRPIVVLARRAGAPVAAAVAPHTRELGLVLPYTPLHHLLLARVGEPIVCTSANASDEPIAYEDDDAVHRLAGIADSFLSHDRAIRIRVDDSVGRIVAGVPYLIRRSRGYVPAPIRVPWRAPHPILACGADLKNTIALARDDQVFVSHHIGDLDNARTHAAFVEAIGHLCTLFEVEPRAIAYDLHPGYHSTRFAMGQDHLEHVVVQHHHAHIASCMADAGHEGPVIGVAFDGLGWGDDGTIWGGELLVADRAGYDRRGWLRPVPMPGGDAATREPWRMAASYLQVLGEAGADDLAVARRQERWEQVLQLARTGTATPLTSSAGRLFDAVAALLGVRDVVHYEGQAAIELEQLADPDAPGAYPAPVVENGGHLIEGPELVAAVVADVRAGVDRPTIAMRFHRGLAAAIVEWCRRLREETGLATVALSGGVFLNTLLLLRVLDDLEGAGLEVLRHSRVPCNDGGISLGQAAVAARPPGV